MIYGKYIPDIKEEYPKEFHQKEVPRDDDWDEYDDDEVLNEYPSRSVMRRLEIMNERRTD